MVFERTEPVSGVDGALDDGQESEDDPVLKIVSQMSAHAQVGKLSRGA